jgi:hypothetical protein
MGKLRLVDSDEQPPIRRIAYLELAVAVKKNWDATLQPHESFVGNYCWEMAPSVGEQTALAIGGIIIAKAAVDQEFSDLSESVVEAQWRETPEGPLAARHYIGVITSAKRELHFPERTLTSLIIAVNADLRALRSPYILPIQEATE